MLCLKTTWHCRCTTKLSSFLLYKGWRTSVLEYICRVFLIAGRECIFCGLANRLQLHCGHCWWMCILCVTTNKARFWQLIKLCSCIGQYWHWTNGWGMLVLFVNWTNKHRSELSKRSRMQLSAVKQGARVWFSVYEKVRFCITKAFKFSPLGLFAVKHSGINVSVKRCGTCPWWGIGQKSGVYQRLIKVRWTILGVVTYTKKMYQIGIKE